MQASGRRHPDCADSLHQLALVLLQLGSLEASHNALTKALDIQRTLSKPVPITGYPIAVGYPSGGGVPTNSSGNNANDGGGGESFVGVIHPKIIETLCWLAHCMREQGDYSAAKRRLDEAHRVLSSFLEQQQYDERQGLGLGLASLEPLKHTQYAQMDTHTLSALVKTGLGTLAMDLSEYERANDYIESSLSLRSYVLGDTHPLTLHTLHLLCDINQRRGKIASAKLMLQRCISKQQSSTPLGRKHPELAGYLVTLGEMHIALAEYEPAKEVCTRTLLTTLLFTPSSPHFLPINSSS